MDRAAASEAFLDGWRCEVGTVSLATTLNMNGV